jgi:hypothetical protein
MIAMLRKRGDSAFLARREEGVYAAVFDRRATQPGAARTARRQLDANQIIIARFMETKQC